MGQIKTLTNLRAVLDYFEIPNRDLAQAINVSPSMVSNWVQGKRALRMSSGSVGTIVDYVLSQRMLTQRDIIWLKKHFEQDGISTDFDSAFDIKRNMIIWLADDGQEVLDILKKPEGIRIADDVINSSDTSKYLYSIGPAGRIYSNDYSARAGVVDIALRLGRIFKTMSAGLMVDICLSSETASTILQDIFIAQILNAFMEKDLRVRMLIAISNDTIAISNIVSAYFQMIVTGNMEIYLSHGMMQPMIHQTSLFIPGTCAVAVTELPDSFAPPVALFITEEMFIKDAADGFDRIVNHAQPLMQFCQENNSKGIADLFHTEFCEEGNLDILSDGVNPLVLERHEYERVLEKKGLKGNALEWRSAGYAQIRIGFDKNLKTGNVIREIIFAKVIKDMVLSESCEVSSAYFMETGRTQLDRETCKAVLKGYVRLLKAFPNYRLAIAPELGDGQQSTRHIKQNRHIMINPWKSAQQTLIYSDQMIMIHEFQKHFNELWINLSLGNRENTIELLEKMAKEMERTRQ